MLVSENLLDKPAALIRSLMNFVNSSSSLSSIE